MKIIVLSENLQKKLSLVNRGISSKSQLPVLLNFLIEAKDEKLHISSTDLEIGIQVEIPANIEETGGITIPAKTFLELITTLSSEKITLQTKEKLLEVKTDKIKSVFQTIPKEEFPNLYEEKGEEIARISKESLQKEFVKVIFAASIDIDRPALSGVLIKIINEPSPHILLVATDGYRLSLKQINKAVKTINDEIIDKPLLVPARLLRELITVKEEGKEVLMYVANKNNQVLFQNNATLLVGRLIEAEFPQYEKIIPKESQTQFFFDREELQKAVKICYIFARETANIVRFSIKKDLLIVSANAPSVGENTVEVEGKLIGEENEIAFNARYLLDLFANTQENEMVLEMAGPLHPGVFKIKEDSSFLHLIMPIRVQE